MLFVSTKAEHVVRAARPQVVARTSRDGFCAGNSLCACGLRCRTSLLRANAKVRRAACRRQLRVLSRTFLQAQQLIGSQCATCLRCIQPRHQDATVDKLHSQPQRLPLAAARSLSFSPTMHVYSF